MTAMVTLIIQAIAGALGGNGVGRALKDLDLGPAGNSIAGGVGGIAGGQVLEALLPALAHLSGADFGALLTQIVASGAGGAVLTFIAAMVKNLVAPKAGHAG